MIANSGRGGGEFLFRYLWNVGLSNVSQLLLTVPANAVVMGSEQQDGNIKSVLTG